MFFWKKKEQPTQITTSEPPLKNILSSFTLDFEALRLESLESETVTITTYLKGLTKDIGSYITSQDIQKEQALRRVIAKTKSIHQHGLELKNLLTNVHKSYYAPALALINQLSEQELKTQLEEESKNIKELEELLTHFMTHETLFNPEKNQDFQKAIQEAQEKGITKEIETLSKTMINVLLDKSNGLKSKIRANPIELLKQKF